MSIQLPVNYDDTPWQERRLVREEYIRIQRGRCYHCKSDLSGPPGVATAQLNVNNELFPENFFRHPVHLHHSHETGLTIGAVHNHCNAVLWQYYGE